MTTDELDPVAHADAILAAIATITQPLIDQIQVLNARVRELETHHHTATAETVLRRALETHE